MRTAISIVGMLAALPWGVACFDPTRPCSTNADCVNGGTCDPGTKTCVAAGNPNDKTPPVFSIVVTPPPPRQDTAKLTEYDPGSPDGGRDAFRRDETMQVTVTSRDQDVDAGSVKLVVHGVAGNPGTALEVQLGSCAAANPAAANPFCREGTIQLAPLPFEAFRAVVPLEVSGADLSSNVGRADAGVNVTRWKWRYAAGAPIYTTPAITDDGTIVFGTSDGGSGSLYALDADGSERWAPLALEPIRASPILGSVDGGQQFAYVGTAGAAGRLLAIEVRDGSIAAACPSSGGYAGPVVGTPALVISGTQSFEGALALANGAKLVNIRPTAGPADGTCLVSDVSISQAYPSEVVAQAADAFVGTAEGAVRAYRLLSGNWVANIVWGGGLGYAPVGNAPVQLALVPSAVVGTTTLRGVFSLDQSTGALQGSFPDGGVEADPSGPIFAGGQYLFGGGPSASPALYASSASFSSGARIPTTEALVGTPVIGQGGAIYLATIGGSVEARSAPASLSWSASLGSGESFLSSPTIGCGSHGASSGVLLIGSTSGNLFAVIVDSPGIEPTSLWPKYQHDVRNTGNPTTPIQSCP